MKKIVMIAASVAVLATPALASTRAANVFMKIAPMADVNVSMPDCTGLRPKPSCSISGNRNGVAPMPTRNSEPPSTPTR